MFALSVIVARYYSVEMCESLTFTFGMGQGQMSNSHMRFHVLAVGGVGPLKDDRCIITDDSQLKASILKYGLTGQCNYKYLITNAEFSIQERSTNMQTIIVEGLF